MLTQRNSPGRAGRTAFFVAPYFAPTTTRFIRAAAGLPGVRLGLITRDPVERLPRDVAPLVAGHVQVRDDALDPQQIADAVRSMSGRLGRPARVFGAMEELQVPLAEVREGLGIRGMGVEAAKNFRDKSRMKDALRKAGVPCAGHRLVGSMNEALEFAREVGFPLVAKPPAGAAARNTFRVEDGFALRDCMRAVPPSPARPTLLEEFVVGDEHSFDSVCVAGEPVWHSLTHYTPGPLEVLNNPWIQWTVLLPREVDHPRYDDIRGVAWAALRALGMDTGLSHMEWFRRRDGSLAVSEVAARPPGAQFTTLISYAHDVDFYRAWARLMIHDAFQPPPRRYAAGIAFLRGQGRGRVKRIHGLARAQADLGPLVVEVSLPRQGSLPASSYEGEGYVVLRHPETAVVAQALERLVSLVQVELG
ncbi:MAG: ATP-grasp domain-containing protein [bacterium]|nr:ATP-grasp domain-containing protein [bacterium]